MSVPDHLLEKPGSPSRERRAEAWIEQAELDGCERCDGPALEEGDSIVCLDDDCGWSRPIPWEEF